jgi:hypothetical protein
MVACDFTRSCRFLTTLQVMVLLTVAMTTRRLESTPNMMALRSRLQWTLCTEALH